MSYLKNFCIAFCAIIICVFLVIAFVNVCAWIGATFGTLYPSLIVCAIIAIGGSATTAKIITDSEKAREEMEKNQEEMAQRIKDIKTGEK